MNMIKKELLRRIRAQKRAFVKRLENHRAENPSGCLSSCGVNINMTARIDELDQMIKLVKEVL